jgi:hypothetical protein
MAAAVAPGWVLTSVAGVISADGGAKATVVSAPDPFTVQIPGLIWPAGYLAVILLLGGVALLALRVGAGLPVLARHREADPGVNPPDTAWAAYLMIGAPRPAWLRFRARLGRLRAATTLMLELSEREIAERPVWLWLATTLALGWLLTQR